MDELFGPLSCDLDRLRESVRAGDDRAVASQMYGLETILTSLLTDAIDLGHLPILARLLQVGIPTKPTVVICAVKAKNLNALSMLLVAGWDINTSLNFYKPSILSYALDDVDVVAWLLERGANPDMACDIGDTPLSHAAGYGTTPVLALLLEKTKALDQGYLMHCAMDRQPPDLRIIEMLAASGAPYDEIRWHDPKSFRFRGPITRGTPLHKACKLNHVAIAEFLLRLGADPDKLSMKHNGHVHPTPREIVHQNNVPEMVALFARGHGGETSPGVDEEANCKL